MEIIGRQLEVGFGVEPTRGVAPANAEVWEKNTTANITEKAEFVDDDSVHGKLEDMDGRRKIKSWVEGDLEGIVHSNSIGYLFYNLYGTISSSFVASVGTHQFSLEQSIVHPSLAIFAKDGGVQQSVFQNGMLNTLEITAEVDNYLRYTASFMAKDAVADASTPAYSADNDFVGKEITIKLADTEAGLSSATAVSCKSLGITFETGLIADHVLGAYAPEDIYNAKMSISGSITKNFVDETFKDLFLTGAYKYALIEIVGDTKIGSTQTAPSIKLTLNKVAITAWDRSGGADELVVEELEFKAYYNATDTEQSTLELKNGIEEYDEAPSA